MKQVDVVIVGAGPSGLCFAISLANQGLSVVVVEKQALEKIANPAFDGREIALTHLSRSILTDLSIWQHFAENEDLTKLKDAHIYNGNSADFLQIQAKLANTDELGYIVPNHIIRQYAYAEFKKQCQDFDFITEQSVTAVERDSNTNLATVTLSNQQKFQAALVVSADSRFSETRRMMGIGAQMRDFGKSMLVCRFKHQLPHDQIAREWFGYAQTIALLPLQENLISVVLTLPHHLIQQINQLDDQALAEEIERRTQNYLGKMQLVSSKHVYPLVAVYADKFSLPNYALVGDAAIGMHPVTAHGFNFGLLSQKMLADNIIRSVKANKNIGNDQALLDYSKQLKRKSLPLYKSTDLIVSIFTNDKTPMRFIRNTTLKIANKIQPFKRLIAKQLTQN